MKLNRKSLLAACTIPAAFFLAPSAQAQEMFIGQVILVANSFCPGGTLPADGAKLPIAPYQVLYSLLGTTYGGDGATTFNLPAIPSPLANTRYCVVFLGLYPTHPMATAPRPKK